MFKSDRARPRIVISLINSLLKIYCARVCIGTYTYIQYIILTTVNIIVLYSESEILY